MKRYLAIFGFVFIGVIAGLIVRGIPIVLQVNAGGGIQADRNGDVNGDARLDMSDAVYLLLHIFRDGPQPVAFAQAEPADLGGLEGSLGSIAASLQDIAKESRRERYDRFIDNEDGTLTDQYLSGRMWRKSSIEGWQRNRSIPDYAGYNDWRLPTAMEFMSILRAPKMGTTNEVLVLPAFSVSGSPGYYDLADPYMARVVYDGRQGTIKSKVESEVFFALVVRDIGPNE